MYHKSNKKGFKKVMAKNDVLLLDGIIDERVEQKLPSERRGEAFEYLAFEQILKKFDLSKDEIMFGAVDGFDDGGIDGFYIFVNGHVLLDPESFTWPKSGAELEVWIITCKHHDTFRQAPLDSLVASLSELFDLKANSEDFKGSYSEAILQKRENLKFAYRKLSPRLNSFKMCFSYASRGDTKNIGDSVAARSNQIVQIADESFGACDSSFKFHGSSELVLLHRKVPNFCLELPFSEVLSSGERYVLLASLSDYFGFVSDEGNLRRYLFDSNVRDFMGLNRVNEDIRDTLRNESSPDFWWLNNGITILATSASLVGDCIQLENIQIVNGLQTTESIFRYFSEGGKDLKSRSVLIKIIVSQDNEIRDSIIRATNNQTDVELASLHATDKIQRDIEDVIERSGYFYERRKNVHSNLGNPVEKVVTPLYLASGCVNLIFKLPNKATWLKSRFMRSNDSYGKVFSERTPLTVWPVIAAVLKRTDEVLDRYRPTKKGLAGERFLKKWRQLISLITVSRIIGKFDFSVNELACFDVGNYTLDEVAKTCDFIFHSKGRAVNPKENKGKAFFREACILAAKKFNIENVGFVEGGPQSVSPRYFSKRNYAKPLTTDVDLEFALKVDELLPDQPWKPGAHKPVIEKLGCTKKEYHQSVEILIDEGIRNKQVDGVVFDVDGNVITFDPDRVDPETLELIG